MLDAACPYCLRIIGPNCLGIWVPALGLNANFGFGKPQVGKLALLAQSGALIGGSSGLGRLTRHWLLHRCVHGRHGRCGCRRLARFPCEQMSQRPPSWSILRRSRRRGSSCRRAALPPAPNPLSSSSPVAPRSRHALPQRIQARWRAAMRPCRRHFGAQVWCGSTTSRSCLRRQRP